MRAAARTAQRGNRALAGTGIAMAVGAGSQGIQVAAAFADCIADGREASTELRIEGLNDRATIARAPGSTHGARLQMRALGTDTKVQWLLDGSGSPRPMARRASSATSRIRASTR